MARAKARQGKSNGAPSGAPAFPDEAVANLGELRKALAGAFLEREEEIDGALTALVARQHVLFLGPPGTAKSALTRALCGAVEGANYFKWLLTKFTTPEEVFGAISLKGLEADEYRRVTARKLPEATVAFLDEVFKANSAILNSLLSILEEREFDNGGAPMVCPLASCFGASNELPKDASLGALFDRFTLRYWVAPLTDPASMKAVFAAAGAPRVDVKLSAVDLADLQAFAPRVVVPPGVLDTFLAVKQALESIGVVASDRRWKACLNLARARALIQGRGECTASDLLVLADAMWHEPDQRAQVRAKVGEVASPVAAEALAVADAARQLHRELVAAERGDADEFLAKCQDVRFELKSMALKLEETASDGGSCPEAQEALDLVAKIQVDAKRRHDRALD